MENNDILGIDPDAISHKLSVFREAKSVAQKKRKMGKKNRKWCLLKSRVKSGERVPIHRFK